MTSSQYLAAWGLYLLGFCGAMLVMWRMTRWQRKELAAVPRVILAAILLTPMLPADQSEYFVPAWMVAAMQWLNHGYEAAVPALRVIGSVALIALLCSSLFYWYRERRRPLASDAR